MQETVSPPTSPSLQEYRLRLAGRDWTVLHSGVPLTYDDEYEYLTAVRDRRDTTPYGVMLWPSSIALAHELAARGSEELTGQRVLELGAGTGLPGIVAASLGARVLQTDREPLALEICRRNTARNAVTAAGTIEHRSVDWIDWREPERHDLIIGADILYGEPLHAPLLSIFTSRLKPGGRILLADPFRAASMKFFEAREAEGWAVSFTKWTLSGSDGSPRPIGVFDLAPPFSK